MTILGFDRALEKQPAEQKTIKADFSDVSSKLVISGYTLSSVDVKVYDSTGEDVTSSMVEGTPTIDSDNNWIYVCIKNGTGDNDYYARFRGTWTKAGQPNQIIERDLLIKVREKGF